MNGVRPVATSAVRDAANGNELRATMNERFGIDAQTISGAEEARLTSLGATSRRGADALATLAIDIGGGSTELVTGSAGRAPDFHVSTQVGSGRQTERHLQSDSPREHELLVLAAQTVDERSPQRRREGARRLLRCRRLHEAGQRYCARKPPVVTTLIGTPPIASRTLEPTRSESTYTTMTWRSSLGLTGRLPESPAVPTPAPTTPGCSRRDSR